MNARASRLTLWRTRRRIKRATRLLQTARLRRVVLLDALDATDDTVATLQDVILDSYEQARTLERLLEGNEDG